MSFIKNIFFYIMLIIIYIVIIEFFSRTVVFINSKNPAIFSYGFDKETNFEISDLSKFEFIVTNRSNKISNKKLTDGNPEKNDNEIIIWAFGASLTYGFSCGKSSSSWPIELSKINKKYKIKNFAFPAKYSEDSIKILNYNLQKNEIKKPDIIIWAHRDEEKLSYHKGIKRNSNRITKSFSTKNVNSFEFFILRLSKTLSSNLVFYYVSDHIISKFNIKTKQKNKPTNDDLSIAIENFRLNTLDAIKLSGNQGITKFLLISLFSDDDFNEEYSFFLKEYFKSVKLLEKEKGVYFLNTKKFLTTQQKSKLDNLYCNNKHFNLIGNKTISNIIDNFLVSLN